MMRATQVQRAPCREICLIVLEDFCPRPCEHNQCQDHPCVALTWAVDAFIALGGNADKTGEISTDKLRSIVKDFGLTIDIEVCVRVLLAIPHRFQHVVAILAEADPRDGHGPLWFHRLYRVQGDDEGLGTHVDLLRVASKIVSPRFCVLARTLDV